MRSVSLTMGAPGHGSPGISHVTGIRPEEGTRLSIGARIFGTLAGLLILYLLVGLMLPGSWRAEAWAVLPAPPEAVFPFLNRTDQWTLWTHLPASGMEPFGPREGPGAGLRWNDPRYGAGEFRIVGSEPGVQVEYEVAVEKGALRFRGILTLAPDNGATSLQWRELGDFGWNPLMGYAARGMARSQGETMRISLERLEELITGRGLSPG
jgi:hypothetical protein